MAVTCLEEEALFSYSHRNPGAKSLGLVRREDEPVKWSRMNKEAELGPCLPEEGDRNREIKYKMVKKKKSKRNNFIFVYLCK